MTFRKKSAYMAAVSIIAFAAIPMMAQAEEAAAETDSTTVIVTGTRQSGIKAVDSSAPIVVLDSKALTRVGQPDLIQSLAQNLPSFTAQAIGFDTANLTLSARLRGVSPNHALVLVDGKRRHTTANLAVLAGAYQGGAAADLGLIPTSAIDHVEVLQDGAAAQYGTDAIAGVVNIITKKSGSGGSIGLTAGEYMDGGGETAGFTFNIGLTPFEKAYLNFTYESKWHGHSFRGGIDPRLMGTRINNYPQMVNAPGYPYVNLIAGDAEYRSNIASLSAGYDFSDTTTLYSFFTYGKKMGQAYENWRTPTRVVSSTGFQPFPLGFQPKEALDEIDFQGTVGLSTELGGWALDLSQTYGKDDIDISVIGSANASLYFDTGNLQRNFYAGSLRTSQATTNLGATKEFDVGMASPLTFAAGFEFRHETYEIVAGDAGSRYKEGSQSFPGYPVIGSGKHDRDDTAFYIDVALQPIEPLKLDIAVRTEHFSDFGDTTVGKITGRYDFSESFALRGTVSTGFRAPTLAESYYTATNVSPTSFFVQLPPNSAGAALVGVDGLKAEKSTNFSVGFVAHPTSSITVTMDAYQISIKDRIAGSGTIYATGNSGPNSAAAQAAILANGNVLDPSVRFTGINIFANGLDTETNGVEFLATTTTRFDTLGKIDWSLSANYNETQVTKVKSYAQVAPQSLYDAIAISEIEDASPKYKIVASALWTIGSFSTNIRGSLYGDASDLEQDDDGTIWTNKTKPAFLVDLDVAYKVTDQLTVTVGANNLFNTYPDKKPAGLIQNYIDNGDNSAVNLYPSFAPFGINGGYYYAKVGYTF